MQMIIASRAPTNLLILHPAGRSIVPTVRSGRKVRTTMSIPPPEYGGSLTVNVGEWHSVTGNNHLDVKVRARVKTRGKSSRSRKVTYGRDKPRELQNQISQGLRVARPILVGRLQASAAMQNLSHFGVVR